MKETYKIIRKEKKWSNFQKTQNFVEHQIFNEKFRMNTTEIKGAIYIGSVVITKSLTKFKPEESEIIIQLAINKVCRLKLLTKTVRSKLSGQNRPIINA